MKSEIVSINRDGMILFEGKTELRQIGEQVMLVFDCVTPEEADLTFTAIQNSWLKSKTLHFRGS